MGPALLIIEDPYREIAHEMKVRETVLAIKMVTYYRE